MSVNFFFKLDKMLLVFYTILPMAQNGLTIVSSQKSVPVLVLELAIYIFFRLFDGNVHVTIQTSQDSCGQTTYGQFMVKNEGAHQPLHATGSPL